MTPPATPAASGPAHGTPAASKKPATTEKIAKKMNAPAAPRTQLLPTEGSTTDTRHDEHRISVASAFHFAVCRVGTRACELVLKRPAKAVKQEEDGRAGESIEEPQPEELAQREPSDGGFRRAEQENARVGDGHSDAAGETEPELGVALFAKKEVLPDVEEAGVWVLEVRRSDQDSCGGLRLGHRV
jgi:hypothetical protein